VRGYEPSGSPYHEGKPYIQNGIYDKGGKDPICYFNFLDAQPIIHIREMDLNWIPHIRQLPPMMWCICLFPFECRATLV